MYGSSRDHLVLLWKNEKLHPLVGGIFGYGEWGMGNGEWGMGKKLPMPNAQSGGAAVPLYPLKGIEFPAAFNE
ncbi:MAG: hypothetical protein RMY63_28505 [Nostoc sp. ChiQUE01b]|nr:hypothetical protein [Nostoc sp. ChiQUE01b]